MDFQKYLIEVKHEKTQEFVGYIKFREKETVVNTYILFDDLNIAYVFLETGDVLRLPINLFCGLVHLKHSGLKHLELKQSLLFEV